MNKLLPYLGKYKRYVLLAPLFLVLEVLMEVLMPSIMGKILDEGLSAGNIPLVVQLGALMIGMALFAALCGIVGAHISATAGTGLSHNVREKLFDKIQAFAFSDVDKFGTASLLTRATGDVTNMEDAFIATLRILGRSPLMLVFSIIMTMRISMKVSMVFLFAIPFIALVFVVVFRVAIPRFMAMMREYDELNNVTQENITAIRVVKSFVREKFETEKFAKSADKVRKAHGRAIEVLILAMPLMWTIVDVVMAFVVWFGGTETIAGKASPGDFVSLFSYTMQILMSMIMFSSVFIQIAISKASVDRIVEVLEQPITIANPENPEKVVNDGSITFENVKFKYPSGGEHFALGNISMEIKSGEMIGIIGGTGSSKSTLVQMIPRLYDVTEGSVKVGGVDVRDYDIESLRDSVAMVLQKNVLFAGTIKENLLWGNPNASQEELEGMCSIAQAHDFIMSFPEGYDSWLEQGGVNLSGGQRQRICIARALLKRPKVIILDDSTSAVDTATDANIRRALKEQLRGTTSIIVAQRVASVESADRIIVMENGMVNGLGSHEELLQNNEIYREIYQSQTRGGVLSEQ